MTKNNGKYRLEFLEEGTWHIRKNGRHTDPDLNHLLLDQAIIQYEHYTRLGVPIRMVYEPAERVVTDNRFLFATQESIAWVSALQHAMVECKLAETTRIVVSED